MIKKKGFTMIELLAAIVILGILSVTTIVAVTRLTEKARKEDERQYEQTLKMAAESYMQANPSELPKVIGETTFVTAKELKEKRYLKEGDRGCVEVHKKTNKNYVYEVKEKCSKSESCSPQPIIEDLSFIEGENFVNSTLYFKVNGGKTSSGEEKKLSGYSYVIYAKKQKTDSYSEVYNSGTLSAYNRNEIVVNKKINEYIDEVGTNYIIAKVEAFNEDGCRVSKSTDSSAFADTEKPICGAITGESKGENDWIKKSKDTRVITVNCERGKGSACARKRFTKTWPNDNEKSAEFGYIEIKSNSGNTELCKVRVNVDMELPKIVVQSGALKGNVIADDNNSIVNIDSNNYKNVVNGWANKANYPNGLDFKVTLSDNIGLASYKWETNGDTDEQQSGNVNEKSKIINIKLSKNGKSRSGKLTVKDKAGNTTVVNISAKIDTKGPTCGSATGGATTWSRAASRTVGVKCSDSLSRCSKEIFTRAIATETTTQSVTIEISDNAGNISKCTNAYNIYLDRTAPNCGDPTGGSRDWSRAASRTVGVKCSDGLSGCASNKITTAVSNEAKTQSVSIKIEDKAQNVRTCTNTYNIYLDRTPPTIYVGSGDKYAAYNSSNDMNEWGFKIKDNLSGLATISSPAQGEVGPSVIYYCYGNCTSGCQTYSHDSNTHKLGENILANKNVHKYWLRKAQIADNVDGINKKDRILMQTNTACQGGKYLVRTANKICDRAGNCVWKEINYDFR